MKMAKAPHRPAHHKSSQWSVSGQWHYVKRNWDDLFLYFGRNDINYFFQINKIIVISWTWKVMESEPVIFNLIIYYPWNVVWNFIIEFQCCVNLNPGYAFWSPVYLFLYLCTNVWRNTRSTDVRFTRIFSSVNDKTTHFVVSTLWLKVLLPIIVTFSKKNKPRRVPQT